MAEVYDVGIIGSGPGGYVSAIRASQLGKKCILIDLDKTHLGGFCLNEGCIPTKAMIHSAEQILAIKKAEKFGIMARCQNPDIKRIVAYSRSMKEVLRRGVQHLLDKNGIDFIEGRAKLSGRDRIKVQLKKGGVKEIEVKNIILAPGAHNKALPGTEVDGEKIITVSEAINLESVPGSLLIVGGGATGVEIATVFNIFGSKVSIVEIMPYLLPREDKEVTGTLKNILSRSGICVFTESKVEKISKYGDKVEIILDTPEGKKVMNVEKVLLSAGRSPNIEGLGLEDVGIELEGEFIKVDGNFRTNIDNIYAVGDVVASPMLAYVAYEEGIKAAETIAGLNPEPIDYDNIPYTVYSTPQIATIGLTEDEALKKGFQIKKSKQFFKTNPQAVIHMENEGFIKVVANAETERILGVHIIGCAACEILSGFIVAKSNNLTVEDVARSIHAHPTFSEISQDVSRKVLGKAIHG